MHHTSWFQNILQSYSNQNSMVPASKQTYRQMEQIESAEINLSIDTQLTDLQQGSQEHTTGNG